MTCPDCEKMARQARELRDQMAVIIQQVAIVARERDELVRRYDEIAGAFASARARCAELEAMLRAELKL